MIEGMIGAMFVLASFVGGYVFRKRQDDQSVPKEYIKQEQQLPPDIEQQMQNIMNAWK